MSQRIMPRLAGRRFSLAASFHRFLMALALRRNRSRLAQLDDHLLDDIGISRETARCEAARKDWDVPDHWLG